MSNSEPPDQSEPPIQLPEDPEFLAKAQAFLKRTVEGPDEDKAHIDIPGGYVSITESSVELFKGLLHESNCSTGAGWLLKLFAREMAMK